MDLAICISQQQTDERYPLANYSKKWASYDPA
jgi:hypothetical protein